MAGKEMVKIAMVGGGLNSFMGPVHRAAIKKAGIFKVVCGAFGSSRQSSYDCQKEFGLDPANVYGTYRDMFRAQARLPKEERVAFVVAPVPNTMHYPVAMAAMEAGIPVLGEKPFTCNLDEAVNLVRKSRMTGVPYRVAMVYPAYPMLARAHKMVKEGKIGMIRRGHCALRLGWMAKRQENLGNRQALWRTDARRNGTGGVVNDLLASCQYVLEGVGGYRISEVCAAGLPLVPGRLIPDDAVVLVRTDSGIPGSIMISQIATGHRCGLCIELTGDRGAIKWCECEPGRLVVVSEDGSEKILRDKTPPGGMGGIETPFGNNEAYIDALSKVYLNFWESIKAKPGSKPVPRIGMSLEQGVHSVAVAEAVTKSLAQSLEPLAIKWVKVEKPRLQP